MDKEERFSLQGPHGGNTANILNKPGSETKTDTVLEYITLLLCSSPPVFSSGNVCVEVPDQMPRRAFNLLYFFPPDSLSQS